MKHPIKTPYGSFESIVKASDYISHNHASDFIKEHNAYDYPYKAKSMDKRNHGKNNSTGHYTYNVIKKHLLKMPGSGYEYL